MPAYTGSFETGGEGWVDADNFDRSGTLSTAQKRTGNFSLDGYTQPYRWGRLLPEEAGNADITFSIWAYNDGGAYNIGIGTASGGIIAYGTLVTVSGSWLQYSASYSAISLTNVMCYSYGTYFDDYTITYTLRTTTYAKDGGAWKPAMKYVKENGIWKPANSFVRNAGIWKQT